MPSYKPCSGKVRKRRKSAQTTTTEPIRFAYSVWMVSAGGMAELTTLRADLTERIGTGCPLRPA
ncbi:hypothetical protein ACWF0M_16665 [Kribbella sp. NPDC055110]